MRFAIAPTQYFHDLGFDTTHWRKSLDGSQAICHAEFALTLAKENDISIYEHNSQELKEILNSEEWSKSEYSEVEG